MLVLLPYSNPTRRYIYAIDLKNMLIGILVPKKKDCRLRDAIPLLEADKLPALDGETYKPVSYTRFRLTKPGSIALRYISARLLRCLLERVFKSVIWDEEYGHSVLRAWQILKSAKHDLRTFYVVTKSKVYSAMACPKNLVVRKLIVVNYVAVMLT